MKILEIERFIEMNKVLQLLLYYSHHILIGSMIELDEIVRYIKTLLFDIGINQYQNFV